MTTHETVNRGIDDIVHASHSEGKSFGQQVVALMQLGVESYYADYRAQRTTFYLADGSAYAVALPVPPLGISRAFDAAALQAAIRGAQAGVVLYPEFMQLSMAAGCVGYLVWIDGKHVSYFGRQGEAHIEHFPQAPDAQSS